MVAPTNGPTNAPVPDPTSRTTQQLVRSEEASRDYIDGQFGILTERIDGQIGRLIQRMDDRDEATKVLHETVTRVPTDMQMAIGHLHELVNEKFDSVNTRFALNDDRQKSESLANEVKVNAAFAAQEKSAVQQNEANQKAIEKSERATNDSIIKLGDSAAAANKALSDKIDDIKNTLATQNSTVNGMMQNSIGGQARITEHRDASAAVYALIGIIVTVVLGGLAVIGFLVAGSP